MFPFVFLGVHIFCLCRSLWIHIYGNQQELLFSCIVSLLLVLLDAQLEKSVWSRCSIWYKVTYCFYSWIYSLMFHSFEELFNMVWVTLVITVSRIYCNKIGKCRWLKGGNNSWWKLQDYHFSLFLCHLNNFTGKDW